MANKRVALVCMPFGPLSYPSIGISLLQAALRRRSIPCDIHYLNMSFASRIGLRQYFFFGEVVPRGALVGEWLFSHQAYDTLAEINDEYLRLVLRGEFAKYFSPGVLLELFDVREAAENFIADSIMEIDWSQYAVVGFTSSFQQNLASLALARRLKSNYPGICTMLGGANCEGEMGAELHARFPFIDYVCSGEGDLNFPELVARILDGGSAGDIDGIIGRTSSGSALPTRLAAPVSDLDALPFPNYDDYFEAVSRLNIVEGEPRFTIVVPFESSRGCWWGAKMHCTFCGLNGLTMAYRMKTPERAVAEVEYLARRYQTALFAVDNILPLEYLDTFFPAVASRNLGVTFHYEAKVNLTRADIDGLHRAGVRHIQPGVESLSTSVLKLMKKGCSRLQNIQLLKWCKEIGIRTSWNLLFGFPRESATDYDDMAELMPSLWHLDPPEDFGRLRLDRFSPYFMRPHEYGITNVRPFEAYRHIYPFSEGSVARIAYHFECDCDELPGDVDTYTAATVHAIQAWQDGARRGAVLEAIEEDTCLRFHDTRSGAAEDGYSIEDPWRSVYLFCDRIRGLPAIKTHVREAFPALELSEQALVAALDNLVVRRLMVREGNAYLALATAALTHVENGRCASSATCAAT